MERDTNKLPEDFKAKWIAALRSGEYDKAKFTLRNEVNAFCCLGVACVIYNGKHPSLNGYVNGKSGYESLPAAISGGFSNRHASRLIDINDSSETFEPVIKYIEENL